METRTPGDRRITRPWPVEEPAGSGRPADAPDPERPYALVVVDVGADGAAVLGACDLVFEGGSASVTIDVLAEVARDVLLPVVARRSDDQPAAWDLLSVGRVRLPSGTSVTVTIRRGGPDGLMFTEPSGVVPDGCSWAEIRAIVAEADARPPTKVDLVCAVELNGTDIDVAARIAFLQRLIDRFHRLPRSRDWLRVALLGYRDHDYDNVLPDVRDPVRVSKLDVAEAALRNLTRWKAKPAINLLGAPAEDAFAKLAGIPWRAGSKRVLVTLGMRAPHRKAQGRDVATNVCPQEHDWKKLLEDAVQANRLKLVAVRDGARQPMAEGFTERAYKRFEKRTRDAWRRLGAGNWLDLTAADPGEIARMVGVTGWWGGTTGLPLLVRRPAPETRPA
jgi:hypothetical protein